MTLARTYRPPVINTTSDNDDNTAESLVRKTGEDSYYLFISLH